MTASTALLRGLRRTGYEPQLTQALASVFQADPAFAAEFARLVLATIERSDIAAEVPSQLSCTAEEIVEAGRLDLRLGGDGAWDLIIELKIHAGFGRDWFDRYARALHDVEHAYVVAITRDIPHYGEPAAGSHRCWLGSTRWRTLLPELRQLNPDDQFLADQWPLFLDVLETEGSMGFTQPDPDLFDVFARARLANGHMEEFLRVIEVPLLQALRDAVGGGEGAASLYWRRGGRFSRAKWGKIDIPFRVPASGSARIRAGLIGWAPPASFYVEPNPGPIWVTRRRDARDSVRFLVARGFDARQLRAYLNLEERLVRSPNFEEEVVTWARERFGDIVSSGLLSLPYDAPIEEEDPPPDY